MVEVAAALVGAALFFLGVVVGHRLGTGRDPVSVPPVFAAKPKERAEPEEHGWATREKPHVVDEVV